MSQSVMRSQRQPTQTEETLNSKNCEETRKTIFWFIRRSLKTVLNLFIKKKKERSARLRKFTFSCLLLGRKIHTHRSTLNLFQYMLFSTSCKTSTCTPSPGICMSKTVTNPASKQAGSYCTHSPHALFALSTPPVPPPKTEHMHASPLPLTMPYPQTPPPNNSPSRSATRQLGKMKTKFATTSSTLSNSYSCYDQGNAWSQGSSTVRSRGQSKRAFKGTQHGGGGRDRKKGGIMKTHAIVRNY